MVCHETYKDQSNNWLYPEEIERISSEKNKKKRQAEVKVVLRINVKSKKNTVDPEVMIKRFGADGMVYII